MSETEVTVKAGIKGRTIRVGQLARVEGEGALYVRVEEGRVEEVQLKIFEAPRFFEALLRGRSWAEVPDITARICGICPVAYQMSACHALERALAVEVGDDIRLLRRLLYCGEWIESHGLHVLLLHAPDFLGCADVMEMARDHRELVEAGLAFKKAGNRILQVLGGREIHPVNVRVGGFYRFPDARTLKGLRDSLAQVRGTAEDLVRWTAGLDFPTLDRDYELVSLSHPDEYPMNEGRIVSSRGLDIDAEDLERYVEEVHVRHSTALHAVLRDRGPYFVGPMARFNLCFDRLPAHLQRLAVASGVEPPCTNPFRSITIRAIEMLYACEEALRILDVWQPAGPPFVEVAPRASAGMAATEAPRGLLYHRYVLDGEGDVTEAKIIPPTSQNQRTIEADLHRVVESSLHLGQDELTWRCEQTIRNYDPCISCATHFLTVEVDRG